MPRFLALLLAACSGDAGRPASPERVENKASDPGPAGALEPSAAPGSPAVVLPRLRGSAEGDSAALRGCLYLDSKDGRYLIAALSPSLTWSGDNSRLEGGGRSYAAGAEIVLGGSEAGRVALPWTASPDPSCDSRRVWIATSVSSPRP